MSTDCTDPQAAIQGFAHETGIDEHPVGRAMTKGLTAAAAVNWSAVIAALMANAPAMIAAVRAIIDAFKVPGPNPPTPPSA